MVAVLMAFGSRPLVVRFELLRTYSLLREGPCGSQLGHVRQRGAVIRVQVAAALVGREVAGDAGADEAEE
jgi:hypothetical protein